jgi:hypothetical protein
VVVVAGGSVGPVVVIVMASVDGIGVVVVGDSVVDAIAVGVAVELSPVGAAVVCS